eukprot:CAMPEP_0118695572 /NCGR_PEP_ID=MMETSP0800-20121206/13271_1 /TAXON_ID=210618 ORGANISM="Striatella unipunctata, Strain CCMP2910" /NCGR_SAMPLE_ID=MMETSP0800 /ASSEMBLY_ACC=CAM_ASM_000638 /LENGTH=196 /DNA_ID=CAMNT_0006594399 /DNA_START=77 /DNA_END=667 /DNA_ORIENTATION=-
MMRFISILFVLIASADAFTSIPQRRAQPFVRLNAAGPVVKEDSVGNNVDVMAFLDEVESSGLLSKLAQSKLLSKAQDAGVSLSSLTPLLKLAVDNPDVLVLTEAAAPELLPLLSLLVTLAPPALPLLALTISLPPAVFLGAAAASVGATVGALNIIPDDTIAEVAGQTLIVGILGLAVPVLSVVAFGVISTLTAEK